MIEYEVGFCFCFGRVVVIVALSLSLSHAKKTHRAAIITPTMEDVKVEIFKHFVGVETLHRRSNTKPPRRKEIVDTVPLMRLTV